MVTAMSSLFTLLRAMLAVLLVSTGYCNAAEYPAPPSAVAATEMSSFDGNDGSHCEAHCDLRTMSLAASRDLVKPDLAKMVPPSAPAVVSAASTPVQPRAPPADYADDDSRKAVDDLRTVRLLI